MFCIAPASLYYFILITCFLSILLHINLLVGAQSSFLNILFGEWLWLSSKFEQFCYAMVKLHYRFIGLHHIAGNVLCCVWIDIDISTNEVIVQYSTSALSEYPFKVFVWVQKSGDKCMTGVIVIIKVLNCRNN